jgi:hypothetical protein
VGGLGFIPFWCVTAHEHPRMWFHFILVRHCSQAPTHLVSFHSGASLLMHACGFIPFWCVTAHEHPRINMERPMHGHGTSAPCAARATRVAVREVFCCDVHLMLMFRCPFARNLLTTCHPFAFFPGGGGGGGGRKRSRSRTHAQHARSRARARAHTHTHTHTPGSRGWP